MTTKRGIYIASPLGFADTTREYLKRIHELVERHGFKVLDPWDQDFSKFFAEKETKTDLAEKARYLRTINRLIGSSNEQLIRGSKALIAVLDGVDVDSGTASEVGFAYGLEKQIVGLRTDFRLSADNLGSIVNLQVQYFIEMSGGIIARDLEELDQYLGMMKL